MRHPSSAEVDVLASDLMMDLTAQEADDLAAIVSATLAELEAVIERPEPRLPPSQFGHTDRPPGVHPTEEEDPYGAWVTRCRVTGADDGPLAGMTVGLKDTVSLAGVKLTLNSPVMAGYVPTSDATIVTRLLDAGADIVGKNTMTGFGARFGIPRNPTAPAFSIGGSTAGGAAAVAAGDCDIAIGGDQGGSIRLPASYGGLVGLKPTHGLLPYTGIVGHDRSIDHTGPITRTVEAAALATEAMAGPDGLDPRQPPDLEPQPYPDALVDDVADLTVGVLEEGFGLEQSEEAVDRTVRAAVDELAALGAETTEVSIPGHADALPIVQSILICGQAQTLGLNGANTGSAGWYDTDLVEFMGRARRAMSDELPVTLKAKILVAEVLRRRHHNAIYGRATNAAIELRAAYDEVLSDVDALALPTAPGTPEPYGERKEIATLRERGVVLPHTANAGMFNVTHHPAITVPCGTVGDAPVGMMLVGGHFDEATLFRLAHTFGRHTDHGVTA